MTDIQPTETDADLQARHQHVTRLIDGAKARLAKIKPGARRDAACRHIGALEFSRLQIESKMEDRGIGR